MNKIIIVLMILLLLIPFSYADIIVEKLKKPTLSLSLSSGGNLNENNNYYFTGIFNAGRGGMRDGGYMSGAGNMVNITTNSSHKTVIVHWQTQGNITSIANNSDGTINVTAFDHCLDTGDTINIAGTTDYNGDYTITWIDYDHYKITAVYVSNQTGNWSDDTPFPNDALGIQLYVNNESVQYPNGSWIRDQIYWSHKEYLSGYNTNNITYDELLVTTIYSIGNRFCTDLCSTLDDYIPDDFVNNMGKIIIIIGRGEDYSLEDLKQPIIDAHVEDITSISSHSLTMLGGLESAVTLTSFEVSYAMINLIGGKFYNRYKNWHIYDSQIRVGPLRRAESYINLTRCNYMGSKEISMEHVIMTDCSIGVKSGSTGISSYLDGGVASSKTGLTTTVSGGKVYNPWIIYPLPNQGTWKHMKHTGGYLFANLATNWTDTYPNHIFEDIELSGDYKQDIGLYILSNGMEETNLYDVTTTNNNGVPRVVLSSALASYKPVTANFWYGLNIKTINNKGIAQNNSNITVTDNNGTVYTWLTNENGTINEWLKSFNYYSSAHLDFRTIFTVPNKLFYPFTIGITHPDYLDKSFIYNITSKLDLVVNLEDDYPWEINGTIVLNPDESLIIRPCV